MTFAPINSQSSFLPQNFDLPSDTAGLRNFMDKRERLTASILNIKENGNYENQEILTGQQWFNTTSNQNPKRYTYRKVIDFGSLPAAAGIKSVPHGITGINGNWFFTAIYGTASDPLVPVFIPIPQVNSGPANDSVGIFITSTNVNIQVSSNSYASFTQCYIILEYIKG